MIIEWSGFAENGEVMTAGLFPTLSETLGTLAPSQSCPTFGWAAGTGGVTGGGTCMPGSGWAGS